ncbi:MAG TPA: DUF4157 domain-containing protein [Parafilimonas sp.]|nr:DUF4157 domain-containing protein [Parafilimonas sp.]
MFEQLNFSGGSKEKELTGRSKQTFFQPKLSVDQPGDPDSYRDEQEANAVADRITRQGGATSNSFFSPSAIRRKTGNAVEDVNGGRSLSQSERSFFESRMGYDFSNVRIHTDGNANESAKNINALAYTHRNDIVFGPGQYQPNTTEGKRLLAHELTHVVQQNKFSSTPNIQRDVGWARGSSGLPYGPPLTADSSQKIKETISNAPEAYKKWNLKTSWTSKFQVAYDLNTNTVTVIVKLYTSADAATKAAWEKAIESKWSKKYKIQVLDSEGKETSKKDIMVDVQWVDDKKDAHYVINPTKAGDTRGGRAGLAGTTSMTDWGVKDTVDVAHEFGHMLGNAEEYFTTNGVDYTEGGKKRGFRDTGGGIMNNPAEDPAPRHYELVRKTVVNLLGAENKNVKVI